MNILFFAAFVYECNKTYYYYEYDLSVWYKTGWTEASRLLQEATQHPQRSESAENIDDRTDLIPSGA